MSLMLFLTIGFSAVLGQLIGSSVAMPQDAVVQELSQKLDSLQAQVNSQQTRIDQLEAENRRHVVFAAHIPQGGSLAYSAGAIIPFHSVITNDGHAYNAATAVFTAPFPGDYFFAVHLDVSTDYEKVSIRKNDHVMVKIDKDDGVSTHLAGSVVINLRAGDVVTVNQDLAAGHMDTGNDCVFSGFFIH